MVPSDTGHSRHQCTCGPDPDTLEQIVEHSECGECVDISDRRIRIPGVGDSHDVHRRNISTLASPVILMFDGFHNIVYHVYLATR